MKSFVLSEKRDFHFSHRVCMGEAKFGLLDFGQNRAKIGHFWTKK